MTSEFARPLCMLGAAMTLVAAAAEAQWPSFSRAALRRPSGRGEMNTRLVLSTALWLLVTAAAAAGHHSFSAEYDDNQPFKLTGAVTKIEWTNPHVYFFIDVKDPETGRVSNWAMEMGAPAVIARNGWRRSSMKIGDLVTVEGFRAKSGRSHGNARSVTLASTGQRLGAGSSFTGSAQ